MTLSLLETLSSALWPILVGGVLAILLGRWGDEVPRILLRGLSEAIIVPVRRRAVAAGEALARADSILRQWPAAGLSLLALAIVLGAAMLVGR